MRADQSRGDNGQWVDDRLGADVTLEPAATVTVLSNTNQPVTLNTTEFSWDAVEVFSSGQCAAFAAALIDQFPDAAIRVAHKYDRHMLIHAWIQDGDHLLDAGRIWEDAEQLEEQIAYEWGTHDVVIEDITKDELVAWLSDPRVPNTQDWAAAEQMVAPYLEKHFG